MGSMGFRLRFLVFLLPFILSAHGASVKKEFSLNPPYIPDGLQHWDLVGSAKAQPQVVRLTEELPRQKGVIWNKNRVLSNSWEVQMNFRIAGKKSSGEGIALWYTRDPAEIGPVFGSRDYFCGLGIFIDTVTDSDHHAAQEAYVSAIVNNGSLRLVDSRLIGECQTVGRNLNHPSKIAVSYSRAGTLSVFLDTEGSNKWKLCFTSLGVHLPTGYRFGLSASTEFFADTHEILSLQILDLDPADKVWEDRGDIIPFAENVLPPTQHEEESTVEEEEEEALTEEEERAIEELMRKEKERLQEVMRREAEKRKDEEERKAREEKERQARVISEKREKEEKQKEREEHQRKEREEKQRKEREEQQRKERENEEKLAREKREVKEEIEIEEETAEEVKEDVVSPPVSFTRKAIYVLGTVVIFLIAVKLFRKYSAQRRERLHKRLY